MLNVIEITFEYFKQNIYEKYEELFSDDEQRSLKKLEKTYICGIEKIYKITLDNVTIGFFMIEKIDGYPYFLDYFAIFNEFQNKGYGTEALKLILENIVKKDKLIGEIEKEDDKNLITHRRYEFYRRLGFKKTKSEYFMYNVFYEPIIYPKSSKISKNKLDKIFFEYYKLNSGEEGVKKYCKIIK